LIENSISIPAAPPSPSNSAMTSLTDQSAATPVANDNPVSAATSQDFEKFKGYVGQVLPLLSSPTNIVLFLILLYVAYLRLRPRKVTPPSVISDEPIVFTYYTPVELAEYDGKANKRILMGIRGRVYDVTAGAHFYGPGGPYGNFAGRDASRGLSKGSFDEGVLSFNVLIRYDYAAGPADGSVG
jgi:predicted heme/steroid binding protein